MLLGIDHVVLAVEDPDGAAAELEAKLGLAASPGGRHEALGTFNRLIWLGDAYVELVSVFDRERAAASWFGRPVLDALDRGGGLVTWVVAVDDLDEALRWAPPDSGLSDATAGQRERADGAVVRWRVARPDIPSSTEPFLIEHDTAAAEWTPPDRAVRAEAMHPLGGRVRLAGIEVGTPSPAVAAGRLRRILAAAVEPAGRGTVRVRLGRQEARFIAAEPPAEPLVELLADVPLRTRVTRIGDCRLRLRGQRPAAVADPQPDLDATV
jgi:hypothetical protein